MIEAQDTYYSLKISIVVKVLDGLSKLTPEEAIDRIKEMIEEHGGNDIIWEDWINYDLGTY